MSKIKLVLRPDEFTSFTSYYLEEFWREYFDIEWFDSNKSYSVNSTVFAVWWMNANDNYTQQLKSSGYKVAVDNLWELPRAEFGINCHELNNSNWFWYNESLWWRALRHHNYIPDKSYKKIAFMPINKAKTHRSIIVEALGSRLDNFVWSYQDKKLPNDADKSQSEWQRFLNPEWYNDTYFSVIVETQQQGTDQRLTEKTFKACAGYHPFLLIGQHRALSRFKQLGFETFNNIFDESYDEIADFDLRLNAVIKNIDNFEPVPYDAVTVKRLQHNHNLFFDEQLVKGCIVKEIIEPLLEYAET